MSKYVRLTDPINTRYGESKIGAVAHHIVIVSFPISLYLVISVYPQKV